MFVNAQIQSVAVVIAASGVSNAAFYFPGGARITRYFAVLTNAGQAAHATLTLDAVFTDEGTDGSGSTVLATLTNDSDLADSVTRESGAWVTYDAKELHTENRPGGADATNVADEIAPGGVVSCIVTGAGATAGTLIVGIEYRTSD